MNNEADVRAIAHGDRAAYAALYRRLQAPMRRYAAGLLAGDLHAAEDVVDDAFLDIWRKSSNFSGTGSAEGWIRRIVRNKAVDWLRKSKQTATVSDDAVLESQIDPDASPEEQASLRNEAAWLRQGLSVLSVEQREAIILCYFEDRSLSEIAQIAGCPQNTVKTRLFHARRRLRQVMYSENGSQSGLGRKVA